MEPAGLPYCKSAWRCMPLFRLSPFWDLSFGSDTCCPSFLRSEVRRHSPWMHPRYFWRREWSPTPGFHLTTFLGRGGWGEVWKAERDDGQVFALQFSRPIRRNRRQEIRALQTMGSLHHPNLLHIDNVWSCSRHLVVVMELAEGSLLDLMAVYHDELQMGLYPEHACFYLQQAAAAIDFLNTRQHIVNGQRVAFRHRASSRASCYDWPDREGGGLQPSGADDVADVVSSPRGHAALRGARKSITAGSAIVATSTRWPSPIACYARILSF